jgi:uncharacterized protein (UPF0335 family)
LVRQCISVTLQRCISVALVATLYRKTRQIDGAAAPDVLGYSRVKLLGLPQPLQVAQPLAVAAAVVPNVEIAVEGEVGDQVYFPLISPIIAVLWSLQCTKLVRPRKATQLPMAGARPAESSALSGLAASTSGSNELARRIAETEQELREVKQEIKDLAKRLDANEFTPDQHYPSVEKVQSKIERLENEKVALRNKEVELLREKNIHLEQQQQSGAGTSMLPVCRARFCKAVITCAASVCEDVQLKACMHLLIVYASVVVRIAGENRCV